MRAIQSDAGRSKTHPNETNDCAVVAFAHSTGIPYDQAHRLLASAGRRPRCGTRTSMMTSALNAGVRMGLFTFKHMDVPSSFKPVVSTSVWGVRHVGYRRSGGRTVADFVRSLPKKGRFYLCCTTHAFAVVDGVVYDNLHRPKSRARMVHAFEITTVANAAPLPQISQHPPQHALAPVVKPYTPTQTPAEKLSQQDISELWQRLNKLEGRSQ